MMFSVLTRGSKASTILVRSTVFQRVHNRGIGGGESETERGSETMEKGSETLEEVLESPYKLPPRLCILCKHKIELDYKNPRLLSQFVSPLNGIVYDKHITGLCELQQTILQREVKKSRRAMLMPVHYKHPKYHKDPALFNPGRPQRFNPH